MSSKSSPIVDRIRVIPRPEDFLNRNVGSSGEVYYSKAENTLRLYSGKLAGGYEVVTENNIRRNTANAEIAAIKYDLTVVGPTGEDVGNKYNIEGEYKPKLNLIRGFTYIFDQTDSTNLYYPNLPSSANFNTHPLQVSITEDGIWNSGVSFNDGVIYLLNNLVVTQQEYLDKFNSSTTRQILITLTKDTPDTLYYYCTNHAGMGNELTIGDPGSGSGGATLQVISTPPEEPENGDLWFNSDTGTMYVYVQDTDSGQWVQPTGVTIGGTISVVDWVDISGKPTIATDINQLTDTTNIIPTSLLNLGISDGTVGQVLTTNGSGSFTFQDVSGSDVDLTAFSVVINAASGAGNLTYNNTNGVFSYTPPALAGYATTTALSTAVANSDDWDTAYSWGDHSTQGYLTSGALVETDTLATVTARGATTATTLVTADISSSGTISADTFSLGGVGTPELTSASTLTLESADGVLVTGTGAFRLPNLTETQRNNLTPSNGDVIYNITSTKIEAYQNGTWIELDTGAAA